MTESRYPSHCTYRIATGATLKDLEKAVNEIIAQGWNEDNSRKWEIHGDVGRDDRGFFQVLISCPVQSATAHIDTQK